jgi:BirA family biotin operon repressor/biotin-[acetyl-CoA-carboxylase] ligase
LNNIIYIFSKGYNFGFSEKQSATKWHIKNADNAGYLWIDLENEGLQKFFHKKLKFIDLLS